MLLDRALCDDETLGDPAVRSSFCHQAEDLALSWRQVREGVVAASSADEL